MVYNIRKFIPEYIAVAFMYTFIDHYYSAQYRAYSDAMDKILIMCADVSAYSFNI